MRYRFGTVSLIALSSIAPKAPAKDLMDRRVALTINATKASLHHRNTVTSTMKPGARLAYAFRAGLDRGARVSVEAGLDFGQQNTEAALFLDYGYHYKYSLSTLMLRVGPSADLIDFSVGLARFGINERTVSRHGYVIGDDRNSAEWASAVGIALRLPVPVRRIPLLLRGEWNYYMSLPEGEGDFVYQDTGTPAPRGATGGWDDVGHRLSVGVELRF